MKEYNESKARRTFVILKLLEALAIISPYFFGLINNYFVSVGYDYLVWSKEATSFFGTYLAGLSFILTVIITIAFIVFGIAVFLFLCWGVGYCIYLLLRGFVNLNWAWAKRISETPEGRIIRLTKYEENRRKKYPVLTGDTVRIKENLKLGKKYGYGDVKFVNRMDKYKGKEAIVGECFEDDDFEDDKSFRLNIDNGDKKRSWWVAEMVTLVKKRPVPEK
jgi:hypothetical protein